MNAARQRGRHGATFPARRQALSRGEVLHCENIQSLSCVEARNFSPLTRGASRPGWNFPDGTGGTIENCIYAREKNLLPLFHFVVPFLTASRLMKNSMTQGGYHRKLHSRVTA